MKNIFARSFAAVILAAMLFITSCFGAKAGKSAYSESSGGSLAQTFNKAVEYEAFSPLKDLSVPDEFSRFSDYAQIEKSLYIVSGGAVYCLNIETGESSKLFETGASRISASGGVLYLFDPQSGNIASYSQSGEMIGENAVEGLAGLTCCGFEATENYLTIMRQDGQKMQLLSVKKGGDTVESTVKISGGAYMMCSYKEDSIFVFSEDPADYTRCILYEFNAKSGKLSEQGGISAGSFAVGSYFDACYDPKADSVVFMTWDQAFCVLCEYSLESRECIALMNFEELEGASLSVYENIVSILTDGDIKYRCFDRTDPPEYITVAYSLPDSAQTCDVERIITGYEMSRDITVRTVVCSEPENLKIKLMAGDGDIDILCTYGILGPEECILSHTYADLGKIEGLGERIASNVFTDFACKAGSEYFGIPYGIMMQENRRETLSPRKAIEQYAVKNIDILNGKYCDGNGDELYKVLKFHYENPNGAEDEFYDFEYSTLQTDYLILNPASKKQELSADFLEYFFDVMSGEVKLPPVGAGPDTADGQTENTIYLPFIPLESTENVYLSWQMGPYGTMKVLNRAYYDATQTDGSSKELKKLAKETAAEVAMRIGE